FTYSIGSWFNLQVEQTLQDSMEVARDYYSHLETGALQKAKKIEGFITRDELFLQTKRPELQALVDQKLDEYELGALIVLDQKRKVVVSKTYRDLSSQNIAINYKDLIEKSVDGEGVSEVRAWNKKIYLVVVEPLTE
ncbi:MAG: PAS domain-containing sensor histidine kinase, partial [Nitrospinaceae bacterium]|nr:PAS domain-containing sensor histidine kinase [Nitrospinaceae bacterium]NIR56449.1 PAS domain-containing sensor histidine kinase [Nitrospinaceae bacterium]NIS86911.1 PAS domain-containing sensor histidine kinase [Nitrospinaceae bacterium]NIT83748.1 PAS domain-containing sensor histidine kinase [Nitrospinaceae bacterium]NIU45952.1 PAS domain-containing sensor histidine kinase [Nitrospinaceae bacterium]